MFLVDIDNIDPESPYRRIRIEEVQTPERLIWKEEQTKQLLGIRTANYAAYMRLARKAEARLRRIK